MPQSSKAEAAIERNLPGARAGSPSPAPKSESAIPRRCRAFLAHSGGLMLPAHHDAPQSQTRTVNLDRACLDVCRDPTLRPGSRLFRRLLPFVAAELLNRVKRRDSRNAEKARNSRGARVVIGALHRHRD